MKRLYVGNIPWSTTEDDLRARFGAYGPLASVRIITDRETGKSKGFAFVEFENEPDAREAKDNEDGTDMGGRTMRVDEAVAREQTRRDGPRGGNGHRRGGGRDDHKGKRRRSRDGGGREHRR
jgi:RNA recognition motif-containing protein